MAKGGSGDVLSGIIAAVVAHSRRRNRMAFSEGRLE